MISSRTEMVELTNMCMICNNGYVLVQNQVKSWKGIAFPGDHIEPHESIVDSVVREIKEETGLTISNVELCGIKQWLTKLLKDLEADKNSFASMGINFEEKAFYDILIKVRDTHGFPYEDAKCVALAKEIKKLVDDKAQYADWSTRDDIKSQLNMDLIVLLYENGYPPEWNAEVYEKVLEQAENFRKYSD